MTTSKQILQLKCESCECCLVPAAVVALEMVALALAFVSSIVRHEAAGGGGSHDCVRSAVYVYCCYASNEKASIL
jgi:hypothetical protein